MSQNNQSWGKMPRDQMNPVISPAETTGKYLVLFNEVEGKPDEVTNLLESKDAEILSRSSGASSSSAQNPGVAFQNPGVALMNTNPNQDSEISSLNEDGNNRILTVEEEKIVEVVPIAAIEDTQYTYTWGLIETEVINSGCSGKGIKIAILDTGFDLNHPDFVGRKITSKSFVEGEAVQDEHGHGTHCTGTACGPRYRKGTDRGYGIAYEAEIYIGKVLNNQGKGNDRSILAGIEWAIEKGCQIISMSIGGAVTLGQSYSQIYETIAHKALNFHNVLIIAAAGNDSHRNLMPSITNPVSHPGNCQSIMAVGAVDSNLKIASFSNQDKNSEPDKTAGDVDIVGPGVNVYSSWRNQSYRTISGTSMATPHVAGIAALYAQAYNIRGEELWKKLIQNVATLGLSPEDAGKGLVKAPLGELKK